MLSTIQLVALAGSLIFLAVILHFVRRKKLKEAYALLWIISGVLMVIVSVWTSVLKKISDFIGIYYPPMTLFLILFGGMLLILLQYSLVLSKNQDRIAALVQEIALLKAEMAKLRKDK